MPESKDTLDRNKVLMTASKETQLEFEYPDSAFGVIVRGIDWDHPVENEVNLLTLALRRNLVVVLRGQPSPTHEQRDRFFSRFGILAADTLDGRFHYNLYSRDEKYEIHRRETEKEQENFIVSQEAGLTELVWHTDHFHKPQLKTISVLESIEFEKGAAETYFRDMYTVCEILPKEMRHRLEYKQAAYFDTRVPPPDELPRLCDSTHLIFTPHPDSGRRCLYVHDYTSRIVGIPEVESQKLIEELRGFANKYAPFYSHAWQAGDLVFWDNVGVQHRRPRSEPGPRRVMRLYEGVAER